MEIRILSGRYRGTFPGGEVELRVDVDGIRPMHRLSGDFLQGTGVDLSDDGSFIVDAPTISEGTAETIVEGSGRFSDGTQSKMRVILSRIPAVPQAPFATLQILRENGTVQKEATCAFESGFFRTVMVKEDVEVGVHRFLEYDSNSILPSAASPRLLTIAAAFEEAGIEVRSTDPSNPVGAPKGREKSWSNAELHAAMEKSFEDFVDAPQWKVWLLHARRYETDGTLGMMFDEQGRERQGCAVFYRMVGGSQPSDLRDQLYTCLHELGHCFNLYHSFQRSPVMPAVPVRRDALSWMNYPPEFPGGEDAFWPAFPFQFDDPEVVHLRHGFHDDVIMGGRPFEENAALLLPEMFRSPVRNASGLALRLESPGSLNLGEPVWVELRLSLDGATSRVIHPYLHPRDGYVQIVIRRPGGEAVVFEPVFRRCRQPQSTTLDQERPALYESVYLGFGKRGLHFRQPGLYQVRALYHGLDGSRVLSNLLDLRIRSPFCREDDEISERFLGDQQGKLFAFRGSDAESLSDGNRKLEEVIELYGDNPLASYARMVKGYNWAREFKTLARGEVRTRSCKPKKARKYIEPMIDDFVSGRSRINNITFSRTIRRLAEGQLEVSDRKGARETLGQLEDQLLQKRVACKEPPFNPYVLRTIRDQVQEVLAQS